LNDYFSVAPQTSPANAAAANVVKPPERPLPQQDIAMQNIVAVPSSHEKQLLQQIRAAERVALERMNAVLHQIDHKTPSLEVRGTTTIVHDVSKISQVFFS
jgi:hypothetical protein